MKLYYAPGVCSLSPHIVSRELGLPLELTKVSTKDKTMEGGGDFREINPLGYVPVLELDDGTRLTEGPAIVQWIADRVPETTIDDSPEALYTFFERVPVENQLSATSASRELRGDSAIGLIDRRSFSPAVSMTAGYSVPSRILW